MKRILITGTNGLLGQKLVQLFLQETDYEVIASSIGDNRLNLHKPFQYYPMDITDQAAVSIVFEKIQPDMVIHAAAMTQVDHCEEQPEKAQLVNVIGTKHLVKASEQCGSFFLYVSTDFVFDGKEGMYREEALPNPPNFYGETKLAAEQIVQASPLTSAIVRTVLVYGIAQDLSRSNLMLWVKRSLEAKKPIRVVNDQWRTATLVEDLAIGCSLIVKKQAKGIFHICGKDLMTPYQMALATAKQFNLDPSFISPTNAQEFVEIGKRPPKTGLNIEKARKVLDFEPRSFDEGLLELKRQLKE